MVPLACQWQNEMPMVKLRTHLIMGNAITALTKAHCVIRWQPSMEPILNTTSSRDQMKLAPSTRCSNQNSPTIFPPGSRVTKQVRPFLLQSEHTRPYPTAIMIWSSVFRLFLLFPVVSSSHFHVIQNSRIIASTYLQLRFITEMFQP